MKMWLATPMGRKNTEALTGALLLLFLVEHLVANSLLLCSNPSPYRWYVSTMGHSLIVRVAEVALFILFLLHIGLGLVMRYHYRKMIYKNPRAKKPKSTATRFVGLTGLLILVFLVVHLQRFFWPNRILSQVDFDLYTQAHLAFSNVWYTLFYTVSMAALALHLKHGIRSAMFSAKFIPASAVPRIRTIGSWVGMIVPLGLAYLAAHMYLTSLLG